MSLRNARVIASTVCFPRVSGDEPKNENDEWETLVFSPRERG